ncbi:Hypothetical_protein [Hexamita inflata]|uniref:Hypothetical_protein n=1 Tax=Hexamita inflata TaxID=28002 RepID=A0AA86PMT2_9EUKA|nr:Hypothetical protein HINF_LOCUS30710 [Hexamita inflata]
MPQQILQQISPMLQNLSRLSNNSQLEQQSPNISYQSFNQAKLKVGTVLEQQDLNKQILQYMKTIETLQIAQEQQLIPCYVAADQLQESLFYFYEGIQKDKVLASISEENIKIRQIYQNSLNPLINQTVQSIKQDIFYDKNQASKKLESQLNSLQIQCDKYLEQSVKQQLCLFSWTQSTIEEIYKSNKIESIENELVLNSTDEKLSNLINFHVSQVQIITDYLRVQDQQQAEQGNTQFAYREAQNVLFKYIQCMYQVQNRYQFIVLMELFKSMKQYFVIRSINSKKNEIQLLYHKKKFTSLIQQNKKSINEIINKYKSELNYVKKTLVVDLLGLIKEQEFIQNSVKNETSLQNLQQTIQNYMDKNLIKQVKQLTGEDIPEPLFDEEKLKQEISQKIAQEQQLHENDIKIDTTSTTTSKPQVQTEKVIELKFSEQELQDNPMLQLKIRLQQPTQCDYSTYESLVQPQYTKKLTGLTYVESVWSRYRQNILEQAYLYRITPNENRVQILEKVFALQSEQFSQLLSDYASITKEYEQYPVASGIIDLFFNYELEQLQEKLHLILFSGIGYQRVMKYQNLPDLKLRFKNLSDISAIYKDCELRKAALSMIIPSQANSVHQHTLKRLVLIEHQIQTTCQQIQSTDDLKTFHALISKLRNRTTLLLVSQRQFIDTAEFLKQMIQEESARLKTLVIEQGIVKKNENYFSQLLFTIKEFQSEIERTGLMIQKNPSKHEMMQELIQKMIQIKIDIMQQLYQINGYTE